MKPGKVAELIGISPKTVNKWSGEFKDFLSPSGQGGGGRHRNFSDRDMQVLHFIKLLKEEGMRPDEIHATLLPHQRESWVNLPPLPDVAEGIGTVPMVPQSTAETALQSERKALLREIGSLQERVENLEKELTHERETKENLLREMLGEIAQLQRELGKKDARLELWESGRLKPEDD